MAHYLEMGSLNYLPNNSDTILNVLTDGLGDPDQTALQILDKCKYGLLYFDPFLTSYIIFKGKRNHWAIHSVPGLKYIWHLRTAMTHQHLCQPLPFTRVSSAQSQSSTRCLQLKLM